ncbi:AtpZ/AtpI family protein [Acidipropionibacterium timonense]|uniref:AtpZ/AtpI family protein n=1 Tax=Acidipropionibacterium timonense TaxID=2161818 RepID=UPI001030B125|nr:AtpZ/AtpI family protein [Acidipropionibacterium timonense]
MDDDRAPSPGPDRTGAARSEDGMGVLSYVLAGLLFYGGIGWLLDRWLHQSWLLPVGMIIGLALSVYLIVKRYGSADPASGKNQEDK